MDARRSHSSWIKMHSCPSQRTRWLLTPSSQRGAVLPDLSKSTIRHDEYIRISRIWLDPQRTGFFRMNVDGIAGNEAIDVEIPPNDSIYIFLEVTVNPDQPSSDQPIYHR